MIVVSDATPISTLLKVDQATLLKKLFDTVIIPEAVSEELMAFHPQIPDFVRVQPVTARHPGCRERKYWAKARPRRFYWPKKLVQTFC
jgi:predicted nucleic acid-binding protein